MFNGLTPQDLRLMLRCLDLTTAQPDAFTDEEIERLRLCKRALADLMEENDGTVQSTD